jgi:ADP-ribose pyrophosphatase
MIVEIICMHWTHADLKPLKGGFSGSFLFLANGRKGEFRTEPMVLKVDSHNPIRKEIKGYNRVKDLLGIHVPTLSPPVTFGESAGIAMELATMEGQPSTLQDYFETAVDDKGLAQFLRLLGNTLSLIVSKVYENSLSTKHFVPYRQFLLHIPEQTVWLKRNLESILKQKIGKTNINCEMVKKMFELVRLNDDGITGDMCLSHGDLNLANIICDDKENIWVIDWTHADTHPLELDFTKMENDTKFVVSKQFRPEDFSKLEQFEEYLLTHAVPADLPDLPRPLQFVTWDMRFKKILLTVKKIREAYFSIKKDNDWLIYRIALLKYGIHTLSFDKSRGLGECDPIQLWYALSSVENLLFQLVADDFHLKIRGERPESYPPRFRISIDQANWKIKVPEYTPPYYVAPEVLKNDRTKVKFGWADSEDDWQVSELHGHYETYTINSEGKPLNPHGRTGVAGRAALGRWGPNPVTLPILTRVNPETLDLEILILEKNEAVKLLSTFVDFDQSFETAGEQYLKKDLNLKTDLVKGQVVYDGYLYDFRQTDNAWIVAKAYLVHMKFESIPEIPSVSGMFNIRWKILNPEFINQFSSSKAALLQNVIQNLLEQKVIDEKLADSLLRHSG